MEGRGEVTKGSRGEVEGDWRGREIDGRWREGEVGEGRDGGKGRGEGRGEVEGGRWRRVM